MEKKEIYERLSTEEYTEQDEAISWLKSKMKVIGMMNQMNTHLYLRKI